ncbi:MAG: HTTM domain-containing protein [Deltaproteobacteria bacterium]|nr:HTTM domain-containing protein [Deltaproteobacteria bacterium]
MKALRRLLALTSTTESPVPLALFRIGVGVSILWLVVPMLLTTVGRDVVGFSFIDQAAGGYRNLKGSWGADLLGGATPEVIFGLLWVSALCGLLLVLGLFGRVPVLVAAITTHIALQQNMDVSGAGDALLGNALVLLMLGDITATLSLDCWFRQRGRPLRAALIDDTPIAAWPRQLAVVQLCIVYTSTGLQKLVSMAWTPFDGFSALYQILQSPHWARFPDLMTDTGGALAIPFALMTGVTIVWEVTFIVVLFKRKWRPIYAFVGVGVHIGILIFMEVGVFSIISVAFYPVLFSPQTLAAIRGLRYREHV